MPDWGEDDWAAAHADGYSKTVFSITPDSGVRERTLHEIRTILQSIPNSTPRILLPGCGSETVLENDIAQKIEPKPLVLCTDFEDVVKTAKHRNPSTSVIYEARNSKNLGFVDVFDAVIVMNSVVAPTVAENDRMLVSFCEALTPGGALIGLFPTTFCALDVQLNIKSHVMKEALSSTLDLENGLIIDTSHDARQHFYTPIQLKAALVAAGFEPQNIKMDIYFMDSLYFQAEASKLYGLTPEDPPIYELFIVARKSAGPKLTP